MNYIDDTIQPMDKKVTCLQKQIDYLDHAKAECINIRGCNPNGYITFAIDGNGNETITGIRNLASPIDGYTTVESLLTDLAGRGGGDLATKIKLHATNAGGSIPIVPALDSTYQEVCYSPILTANNSGLTVDGKIITCNDIDTNGHTVCGADGTFTGTVRANTVSAASVNSTGSVSGVSGSFTNSVTTPSVTSGTSALVLSGDGNPLSIDGIGACLTYGCFCVPTLYSTTSCVTDTANITNVNITGTANICTAVINNIQLGYVTTNSTTGLSLVNACTNERVWLTDTAIGIGNASSAPSAQSVSIGTDSYATDCSVAIGRYACSISDNGIAIGCGACTFSCCGWYILKHIRHGDGGVSGEITMELKYPGGYPLRCDFYNALYAATKPGYDNILWFTGSELIIGGNDKSWKWSGPTEGYINSNNELLVHHLDSSDWHGFSSTCTACYPFEPWRPKIITLTYSLKSCNPNDK